MGTATATEHAIPHSHVCATFPGFASSHKLEKRWLFRMAERKRAQIMIIIPE
jgi:hypothetical protein